MVQLMHQQVYPSLLLMPHFRLQNNKQYGERPYSHCGSLRAFVETQRNYLVQGIFLIPLTPCVLGSEQALTGYLGSQYSQRVEKLPLMI